MHLQKAINVNTGTIGALDEENGEIYGGGLNSPVGTETEKGTVKVNILGGTIYGNINGGSKQTDSESNIRSVSTSKLLSKSL